MGNSSLTQAELFSSQGRSGIGRRAQRGAGIYILAVKASPKGLSCILVTLAAHHQKSFHFSSFWMPSLLPAPWTTASQLQGYKHIERGYANALLA